MSLFPVLATRHTYFMSLWHFLILCACNIFPFHVLAKCRYFTSLWHFLILRASKMSLFHILATWFHFIPPAACSHFMSMLLALILCPCNMSLSHSPRACPDFSSLHHVSISLLCNISLFHVTLQRVLILHPCNMSLFHIPASCMYPFYAPALRVGYVLLSLFLLDQAIMVVMTVECGQFNSSCLKQNPKSFQQVIVLLNFVTM